MEKDYNIIKDKYKKLKIEHGIICVEYLALLENLMRMKISEETMNSLIEKYNMVNSIITREGWLIKQN
jgi:hypothetical protein